MNATDFALTLAGFRVHHASDADAARALGIPLGTFCHWLRRHTTPRPLTRAAILQRIRENRAPDRAVLPAEFRAALKTFRATHRLSQRAAGIALGIRGETLRRWESGVLPDAPALAEVLRRMRMTIDADAARAAIVGPRLIEPDAFAARLIAWRERHRLAQHQAARALGIHTRTVFAWEKLAQFPGRAVLTKILTLLESPPAVPVGTHGWHARTRVHRDPHRSFGRKLRAWRKARGLNQLAACITLGLPRDQALISNWEKGKTLPRPERLARLLTILREP